MLITDFGLAGLADQFEGARVRNGTPAYMAPEQLAGQGSHRPQRYLLAGPGPLRDVHRQAPRPNHLHSHISGERSGPRHRTRDSSLPRSRPAAPAAIGSGGRPRAAWGRSSAAALAAGDTPSPEMVAAAGDTEAISVRTACIALGAVLAGLVVVAVLGSKTNILQQTPFDKPPAYLEQKARDLIESFGYTDAPVDRAYGFVYDTEFQQYGEGQKDPAVYRALLAKGSPPVIRFWYRQSPEYLEDGFQANIVSLDVPPPIRSGMVSVSLNPQGRLIELAAVPAQVEAPAGSAPPNWAALFTAADLDLTRFTPVEPEWLPLVSFDARAAWTGVYPATDVPVRIEAASWRGRPVNFQMIAPWTNPARMHRPVRRPSFRYRLAESARTGGFPGMASFPPQQRRYPGSVPSGRICIFSLDDGWVWLQPRPERCRGRRIARRIELVPSRGGPRLDALHGDSSRTSESAGRRA